MTLRQTYLASSVHVKRQFWMTVGLLIFNTAVVSLRADDGTQKPNLFSRENIVMAVAMIYAAGTLREQFSEVRKEVSQIKERLEKEFVTREILGLQIKNVQEQIRFPKGPRRD